MEIRKPRTRKTNHLPSTSELLKTITQLLLLAVALLKLLSMLGF
jgi:hypothetical protein